MCPEVKAKLRSFAGQAAGSAASQFEIDLWVNSVIAIAAAVFFFAGFVVRSRHPFSVRSLVIAAILGVIFPVPSFALMVFLFQRSGALSLILTHA